MKKIIRNVVAIAIVAFTAFSFTAKESKKEIKTASSKVIWKGYKVTGSHEGTIAIKSGHLNFNDDKLTGGDFIMNMASLSSTDLTGGAKGKLEGHLKSDDFFGVEKFPTATLVFKKTKVTGKNSYEVKGDITIKGTTKTITFDVSIYGNKANVTLKIDRTKFNIKYGSTSFFDDLKNKAIFDDFDLIADLEF